MRRTLSYILGIVGTLVLIFCIFFTSIQIAAFDLQFYEQEYSKLDTASDIGIKNADLNKVTDHLLRYMRGAEDSLKIKAKIDGKSRDVFNKRERDHMVDVRNLFLFWRSFRNMGMVAVLLFIVLILLLVRRDPLEVLSKSYLIGASAAAFVFGAIGVWIATDFNSFWYSFHLLFFTNDLWQLDPRTDILIKMVPEQFFFDICVRIISMFVLTVGALLALSGGYRIYKRHRRNVLLSIKQNEDGSAPSTEKGSGKEEQ